MKEIAGKNIWVIGASSGIGAALAKELAKKGANLALSARDGAALNEMLTWLSRGENHYVFPLDVTDSAKVKETADEIKLKMGRIDSVIFMAATYKPHGDIEEADIEFAKHIMDVNFNGAMSTVWSVLPIFKEQKYGQIVLCASVAGYRGLPSGQPYCASKAALINYAESLRIELDDIDVKVINPGFVKTRLTDKNKFEMPFIIPAELAAEKICKGLVGNSFEIHFPKRFTYIMKIFRALPTPLYLYLVKKFYKK